MAEYAFDVYPANDPAGKASLTGTAARLVRMTIGDQLVDGWYRHVGHGLGGGSISIHADHADAVHLQKRGYVMFVRTDGGDQQIGGFFLEDGEFDALSSQEAGGRVLTFGGPGALYILDRYVLTHETHSGSSRGSFNVPDQWTWVTEPLGAMLLRAIEEGQDHPAAFYEAVQTSFTRNRDSNGNLWTDEISYETPIGTNVLDLYAQFVQLGLVVQSTADIVIQAFRDIDEYRTDRTSATFTAGKTRFEAGVNIASTLTRRLEAKQNRSHVLMRDDHGEYTEIDEDVNFDPLPFPSYHSFIRNDHVSADSVIQRQGRLNLTNRKNHSDQATVRHVVGSGTGEYAPGPAGDYWVLDLVTLHTGTAEHDFDETPIEVASITFTFDQAGNPFVETELGAQYISPSNAAFEERITSSIRDVGSLELCLPTVTGEVGITAISFYVKNSNTLTHDDWAGSIYAEGAQAGDVAIVHAATSQDTTIPTIPSGWTGIGLGGGGSNVAHRGGWRVLDGTEDGVAFPDMVFTTAESIAIHIYRGVLASGPIGAGFAGSSGNNATITYPSLTMDVTDGTSWVITFGHHKTATDVGSDVIAGLTNRTSIRGGEHGGRDTNGGVTSWAGASQGVNASDRWQSYSYELKADPAPGLVLEGDGHADLVGTSIKATRCDHAHHVLRTAAPTVNDDADDGYPVGTLWVRVNSLVTPTSITSTHLLIANGAGAAEWETIGGPDLTGIDFLVGTATGLLSGEIAVGTTPGGELGGTWASPTVDATHAGGTHAPTAADYLVGTAQAGLSGEIVVGTTPGGQLGGTWAAPTLDFVSIDKWSNQ